MKRLTPVTRTVVTRERWGRWRSLALPVIFVYDGITYWIPVGFCWNGASTPWYIWWWVKPWTSWVILASCVHDWLYGNKRLTRREADRIFLHLLIYAATLVWTRHDKRTLIGRFHRAMRARLIIKARIMYRAVRLFGDDYWIRANQEKAY